MNPLTLSLPSDVLREGTRRLAAAGLESARLEAERLLGGLLGVERLALYLQDGDVSDDMVQRFFSQIDARASGIPLQYLLHEADFYGQPFRVAPGVFIPRPETEVIVQAALTEFRALEERLRRPLRVLDAGTGSGCIAATLARALPTCVVVGVELSWNALQVARENVQHLGVSARVHLVQGRWLESIQGRFDGLVANPPYIPSSQVERLPLDVRQEPRLSLDGGHDGMRDLLELMAQVPRLVSPGGVAVFESGEAHVEPLLAAARVAAWVERVSPLDDLAHRPRGVVMTCASTATVL